jgi:hypothetical protein
MRIEGVGEDRRSVRCGIKLREQDNWHWSPAYQLDQESRWAEGVGLFNARTAGLKSLETTGDAVTIAFDYVRFAGKCFTFERPRAPGFTNVLHVSLGADELLSESVRTGACDANAQSRCERDAVRMFSFVRRRDRRLFVRIRFGDHLGRVVILRPAVCSHSGAVRVRDQRRDSRLQ